jgi:hypothetical protein
VTLQRKALQLSSKVQGFSTLEMGALRKWGEFIKTVFLLLGCGRESRVGPSGISQAAGCVQMFNAEMI